MFLFGIMLISLELFMNDIPAWMFCTELLNKIKVEMVNEALDVLDAEIERKSISISGSTIELPDKPNETETKLFVIGKILENADDMQERYMRQAREIRLKDQLDSNQIIAAERAEHFALSIEMIKERMKFSRIAEQWINDVSMHVEEKTPNAILKATANSKERIDLLHFISESSIIRDEDVLTEVEIKAITDAIN